LVVRAVADRKLTQLDSFLGFLEKLGTQPADVFLADFMACGAARYYLQAAIECCADMGTHLIATDTKRRAEDYRSIFRILGEEGVIATEVAAAMEPAASLRNRLVHAYDQVDDRRVHEMLRSSLPILRSFGRAVATYLERVDHALP
jgi:uncharacterized protein YutE (UPF0331/DUF86 family)